MKKLIFEIFEMLKIEKKINNKKAEEWKNSIFRIFLKLKF